MWMINSFLRYVILLGIFCSCSVVDMNHDLERSTQSDSAAAQSGQFSESERFVVVYDMSNGFGLYSEGNLNDFIPVEFANESVRQEFYSFNSDENRSRHAGRVIYCDCVGERVVRRSLTIFRVVDVRFFTR